MQLFEKISRIYVMKKNKVLKISVTVFIILLLFSLLGFLFIYPSYNKISLIVKDLDMQKIGENTYMAILSRIAPSLDKFDSEVLAANNIEDSIDETFTLDKKILEDTHTYVEIDSTNIQGYISEGTTSDAMMRGFWHIPTTAYPGEQGNVVIIGHRFQYIPPAKNTFFNLDKVKIGDSIKVGSDNGDYTYIVTDIKVVDPNDISILKATNDYRLTLVTCTPLWTSKERLVVTAKLDKLYKKV